MKQIKPSIYTLCTLNGETRLFHTREAAEVIKRCGNIQEHYSAEDYRDLEKENKNLRETLVNAKGWILANTKTPIHQLINTINSALDQ